MISQFIENFFFGGRGKVHRAGNCRIVANKPPIALLQKENDAKDGASTFDTKSSASETGLGQGLESIEEGSAGADIEEDSIAANGNGNNNAPPPPAADPAVDPVANNNSNNNNNNNSSQVAAAAPPIQQTEIAFRDTAVKQQLFVPDLDRDIEQKELEDEALGTKLPVEYMVGDQKAPFFLRCLKYDRMNLTAG